MDMDNEFDMDEAADEYFAWVDAGAELDPQALKDRKAAVLDRLKDCYPDDIIWFEIAKILWE